MEFSKEKYQKDYHFIYAGPSLFQFPGFLSLPFFSVRRFIKRMVKKAEDENIHAVLSSDEYIGAIIAGIICKKLMLPGTDPAKIILAQHKYFSRLVQQKYCPDAAVNCELIPQRIYTKFEAELDYPFFVKPVKGTFSLFAKKVESIADLKKHLNFQWYERIAFRSITRPFNHLIKDYTTLTENADFFVAEELIDGIQVTLDGYVYDHQVTICGIVDSIMFPGTNIFERFEYPSKLPQVVQERMVKTAQELIRGIGFQNAQFNIEFFYNRKTDSIHLIEINPRLSYQFGDLYENIDGVNTYEILLNLSLGKEPRFTKDSGEFKNTASFVLRTFKGKKLVSIPKEREVAEFNSRYPEANVKIYGKKGTKLAGEMKAIGSYRYGIVNVGAHSLLDLFAIYEDLKDSLPFSFK